jgi:hypothetical protein
MNNQYWLENGTHNQSAVHQETRADLQRAGVEVRRIKQRRFPPHNNAFEETICAVMPKKQA